MPENIIPFGKYKGQPIEVLQQDRKYCDWLMAQDWFRTQYSQFNTVIINNFQEPSETPEHNKIQAMFTDESFCRKFLRLFIKCSGGYTEYLEDTGWVKYFNDISTLDISNVQYEVNGVDVVLGFKSIAFNEDRSKQNYSCGSLNIEIKPELGDDYPAVLRQMKSNESYILLTGAVTATGATLEQIRKIFKSGNKEIVTLSDVI